MSTAPSFYRTHLLIIPGALALAALLAHFTRIDHDLTAAFYDVATASFPAHASQMLELFGHRFAKTAVTLVWLTLFAATISTYAWPRWHARWTDKRRALWSAVLGMALGPLLVVLMKGLNSFHCPWDLIEFGGGSHFTSDWFVAASDVGHCFPGGHASSGFSLIALYFLAGEMGRPDLARIAMAVAILVGSAFSVIRMAQGAHFLSHNLWAAAICWFVAALACVPLQIRREVSGVTA